MTVEQLQSFERSGRGGHQSDNIMLRPSNKEFLAFSSAARLIGPVEDRERNLFSGTFSFDQVPSIYGNSDSIGSNPYEISRTLQRFVEPSISSPALKTDARQ